MNGHSLKRNQRNLKILLIIGPLLIGAILFVVSKRVYAEHRSSMDLLKQSYEDREHLTGLRDDLDELQTGETGFLLTGDSSIVYLQASLFYQVSDPAAYVLAADHVGPALERLFVAAAVAVFVW